jgi:hypothetical protein
MKNDVSTTKVAVLSMLFIIAPNGWGQNLIRNGGFEFPHPGAFGGPCNNVITVANGWCLTPTGAPGADWTVEWAEAVGGSPAGSPGVLELWRGTVVAPATARVGNQNVELDSGGRPGTASANVRIYQTVSTCPGAPYNLGYSWRPRPGVPAASQNVMVKWAGASLATHTGVNLPWTDQVSAVNGTFGSQKLEFIGGGTGDQVGMLLDAVSLTGPDPNTPNSCTTINIKPGSDPNSINVCSQGSIPVTIWGSGAFDVSNIDPDTLTLGTASVNSPGQSGKLQCSIGDVGSAAPGSYDGLGPLDGHADLTCHFTTSPTMFPAAAASAAVSMTMCSNGYAGGCGGKPSTVTTSTDAIRIVKSNCK